MAKTKNRNQAVLKYLMTHKRNGISSQMGSNVFKCRNFPDVIHNLRKQGHKIETEMREGSNEYGRYTYAVYFYKGEEAQGDEQ